jgi:hypothetical protein
MFYIVLYSLYILPFTILYILNTVDPLPYIDYNYTLVSRDSSVGMATHYCLDGPWIEPISVAAQSKVRVCDRSLLGGGGCGFESRREHGCLCCVLYRKDKKAKKQRNEYG